MIRIRNISRTGSSSGNYVGFKTKGIGTSGMSAGYVALEPTQQVMLPRLAMKDWPASSKQALADYAAQGILEVAEVESSHLYMDKGNNLAYAMDTLDSTHAVAGLAAAIAFATDFQNKLHAHVTSITVHTAATVGFIAGPPTDLASLIVWLAAARLVYETTHRPSAAAHPSVDTSNVPAFVVPISLATAVQELRGLATAYTNHKTWVLEATATVLNIPAILTY